jgi:integrase
MAKITERLTPWKVRALKQPGRYADGGNLYAVVRSSGGKTWVLLYRWHGKLTEVGGGSCRSVSLRQARTWAAEGRAMLHESPPRNPKLVWQQRKRAAQVPTFAEMAQEYLDGKAQQWRSRLHREQVRALLARDCKLIAEKPVNAITAGDVLQVVKLVFRRAPVTAGRLRGRIEQVLAAAQALGHIDPDRRNPAVWRGHMDKLLPARPRVEHLLAMPYGELPRFMAELRALRRNADGSYCIAAYALEFAILTAARSGEVRLARWSEIDEDERLWSLPGERMKSGRPHTVPLADAALAVLKVMRALRSNDWVFPGIDARTPISTKRFERLLRRLRCSCTSHGFRSTFRDWAGDETTSDWETCEIALAHAVGDQTKRAYRRSRALKKHRALLQAWSNYLTSKPADVVALRA